jgi:hypothetical protein
MTKLLALLVLITALATPATAGPRHPATSWAEPDRSAAWTILIADHIGGDPEAGPTLAAKVPPASPATASRPRPARPAPARPTPSPAHTGPRPAPQFSAAVTVRSPAPAAVPDGYGCGPALAYLAAHAAPGYRLECPGYAFGNQAMTCAYHAPQCPDEKIIAIAVPCPAAYMNEASNSWVIDGRRSGPIDPYGYCH